tara:strand:+ start:2069 stop:3532 length:1464 start_codon:yes stop_codon:yes gene_type:complete
LTATSTTNSETVTTGNILTNSTFGTGTTYSTTGWTVSEHTHGHHGTGSFATVGGGNNPGGSVAAEEDTVISQTVSLADDTDMLTEEIQSGFSSTVSADIWFWNSYNNTTTLKQTITGSDGSTTIQQRIIEDTGCGSINCGQFTNYTDTHIQGSNTLTDFDIEVSVSNTNNRTGHWGPDIDDVELSVSYTRYEPITETIQEDLDEIDDIEYEYEELPITTLSIFEEYFTWEDDFTFEEEFFEEEFETIFLDDFDNFESFEELEETAFEELEIPEEFESFVETFTDDFSEEEMEILEEEFAEEFEEFVEEIIEEEPEETEVVEAETEDEVIEEEPTEETEVASNEEEETTEIEEEENEPIAEEETETEILEEESDVEVVDNQVDDKINIKVNDNISVDVKEISLFDNNNKLEVYNNTDFYQPETIYTNVDNSFFVQADLSLYNQGIYLNIGLDNYINTDPIGNRDQKLYELKVEKIQLMIELKKLKEML